MVLSYRELYSFHNTTAHYVVLSDDRPLLQCTAHPYQEQLQRNQLLPTLVFDDAQCLKNEGRSNLPLRGHPAAEEKSLSLLCYSYQHGRLEESSWPSVYLCDHGS